MKDPYPKEQSGQFSPFIYPIKFKYKLEKPIEIEDREFLDVIMSRRSIKDFSKLETLEISNLLYLSTKIHSVQLDETGFVLTKRTSPSAGARHPIDLLVSPSNSIETRNLSYYNPIDHSLGELSISKELLLSFFGDISRNIPIHDACVIWFSIQAGKTSLKYMNPESLIWRDTGALLYCIQLMATYLNHKSCPVGTLANTSFNNLFNSNSLISGGGILVGK